MHPYHPQQLQHQPSQNSYRANYVGAQLIVMLETDGFDRTDDVIDGELIPAGLQIANWIQALSASDVTRQLQQRCAAQGNQYQLVMDGLLVHCLCWSQSISKGRPCLQFYNWICLCQRDQFDAIMKRLRYLCGPRYYDLRESVRVQVNWLIGKLIENAAPKVEDLILLQLRNIRGTASIDILMCTWSLDFICLLPLGGDVSNKNLMIISRIVKLLQEKWDWMVRKHGVIATSVYVFLRAMPEHTGHPELLTMEIQFCLKLIREHFAECAHIGRDLLRALWTVRHLDPELIKLWNQFVLNQCDIPNFQGVEAMMLRPTPPHFILTRISFELEANIKFLLEQVDRGKNDDLYFKWLSDYYFKQSFHFVADVIRFIVICIHPTNEQIKSKLIPRFSAIGRLIASQLNGEDVLYMALFFDWISFDVERESRMKGAVMRLEPGALLMYLFVKSYPEVTMKCVRYLMFLSSELVPPLKSQLISNVRAALEFVRDKKVVGKIEKILKCPTDEEGQMLLYNMFEANLEEPYVYSDPADMDLDEDEAIAKTHVHEAMEASNGDGSGSADMMYEADTEDRADVLDATSSVDENSIDAEESIEEEELSGVTQQSSRTDIPSDSNISLESLLQQASSSNWKFDSLLQRIVDLVEKKPDLHMLSSNAVQEIVRESWKNTNETQFSLNCILGMYLESISPSVKNIIQQWMVDWMSDSEFSWRCLASSLANPGSNLSHVQLYLDWCREAFGSELKQRVREDVKTVAAEQFELIMNLLPCLDRNRDAFDDATDVVRLLVADMDFTQVQQVQWQLQIAEIVLFQAETLSQLITASLEWDSFEQGHFWRLLEYAIRSDASLVEAFGQLAPSLLEIAAEPSPFPPGSRAEFQMGIGSVLRSSAGFMTSGIIKALLLAPVSVHQLVLDVLWHFKQFGGPEFWLMMQRLISGRGDVAIRSRDVLLRWSQLKPDTRLEHILKGFDERP